MTNTAIFVSQSVPAEMVPGQRYNVSVTMKNTGTTTWSPSGNNAYRLGSQNPQDNSRWGLGRVNLPSSVAPGAQATFNFTVTAPSAPGTYNFQWRMVQELVAWFGDFTPNVAVRVGTSVPNAAAFISQSVPTSMVSGQRYNVSVTMKNTGTATWSPSGNNAYRLGSQNPQDNSRWGLHRVNLPSSVAPGAQATFNFTVTAPSASGTYNFQWRMVQELVAWFGDFTPNVAVNVSPASVNTLKALNGLHWGIADPKTGQPLPAEQTQVNQGAGFGSVLILHTEGPDYIWWLKENMKCKSTSPNERIIVRLFHDHHTKLPTPSVLANAWAGIIQFCQDIGVYNFVVLNEIDVEYANPPYAGVGGIVQDYPLWDGVNQKPQNQWYMQQLRDEIAARARPGVPLYLGFPGPSGIVPPGSQGWKNFWDGFKDVVPQYNTLALHAYGHSLDELKNYTKDAATDAHIRFPNHAQRFTEYGIPIEDFGGNRTNRANAYADYVTWVRSGWCDYIYGVYLLWSAYAPDKKYELTNEEATIITNQVGCVSF